MTIALIDPEVTEILYGTPVPVYPRYVELGQAPLNGDIIRMPDYLTNMDLPEQE
jgi:hypothetical protein